MRLFDKIFGGKPEVVPTDDDFFRDFIWSGNVDEVRKYSAVIKTVMDGEKTINIEDINAVETDGSMQGVVDIGDLIYKSKNQENSRETIENLTTGKTLGVREK